MWLLVTVTKAQAKRAAQLVPRWWVVGFRWGLPGYNIERLTVDHNG